jgi:glutathionylspermidine synthase
LQDFGSLSPDDFWKWEVPEVWATAKVRAESAVPFLVPAALERQAFVEVRRKLVLDCCKWDPQVGDVSTLAPFPILIAPRVWRQLARWAEHLTTEALDAEQELLHRPELHRHLGLPRALRRVLASAGHGITTPSACRIIRFDFHWTSDGWRISEANADVPGGFTEASSFAALIARHYPQARPAGDPGGRWAKGIARTAGMGGTVAMLVAAGYMEDHQIVACLADRLRRMNIAAHVCSHTQLFWRRGKAFLTRAGHDLPVDAIVRFYQAEWLAGLRWRTGWQFLFCEGATPVANPGSAVLIESKRFPLVWDQLSCPIQTWRRLLPETRDPRDVPWRRDERWVLKAAFCNTGDEVAVRPIPAAQWRKFVRCARWHPSGWVAQKRFETVAIATPLGPAHPCIGVYTVDGRAAGIYGRLAFGPVTDFAAVDVAVLIMREEGMQ